MAWRLVMFGVGAAAAVAFLVPLARRVALGYGIVDRPRPGKAHLSPTPYLGGLAIALVTVGGVSLAPG